MKSTVVRFVENWSLPLGMVTGALVYSAFHFIPRLAPLKPLARASYSGMIPIFVFIMLFVTFCKVNPRDMKIKLWHFWLILFQMTSCLLIGVLLYFHPLYPYRLFAEGAMVCLICPTATAAAVITGKLGGSESSLTTYTILSNITAAVIIPLLFPLVGNTVGVSFGIQFFFILNKVFPLLICPFLAAWALRVFFPKLHIIVLRHCKGLAFYLWAVSLVIIIGQTLRSLVNSTVDSGTQGLLAVVGLAVCLLQFRIGKTIGGYYNDRISGGQGLGQKNTVFAIWISFMYLSPEVAIAPSSYILWQNIINSWQLWQKQRLSQY